MSKPCGLYESAGAHIEYERMKDLFQGAAPKMIPPYHLTNTRPPFPCN